MNKQEILFTNAICIKSMPEILPFMAIVSGLDKVLSEAMSSFVKIFDRNADNVVLDNIFDDDMSDFILEILVQIKCTFPAVIRKYKNNINKMDNIEKAAMLSNQISSQYPYLKPLDQELSPKDILAYSSLIKDTSSNLVTEYIDIFIPLANLIQADIESNEQAEAKLSHKSEAAIIDGDLDLLKICLNEGFNVDCIYSSNLTPLSLAIEHKSYGVIEYFMDSGIAPYSQANTQYNSHKSSGIDYCLITKDEKALKMLIQSKHLSLETCDWQALLLNNIAELNLGLCILLYENITGKIQLENLIHEAFKVNNLPVLDFILSKTDNPNSKGEYAHTPTILMAVLEENIPALTLFIQHGGDVNLLDFFDNSMLTKAIDEELSDSINSLLRHEAKLICREPSDAYTYLHTLSTLTNTPATDLINNSVIEVNKKLIIGAIQASDMTLLVILKNELIQYIQAHEQIIFESRNFEIFEFLTSLVKINEATLINAEDIILGEYCEEVIKATETRSIDSLLKLIKTHPKLTILQFCLLYAYTEKNELDSIKKLELELEHVPYRYLTWQAETLKWKPYWAEINFDNVLEKIDHSILVKEYKNALDLLSTAMANNDAIALKILKLKALARSEQYSDFDILQKEIHGMQKCPDFEEDIQDINEDLHDSIKYKINQFENDFECTLKQCSTYINCQDLQEARNELDNAIEIKYAHVVLSAVAENYSIHITPQFGDLQQCYDEVEKSLLKELSRAKVEECEQAIDSEKSNVKFNEKSIEVLEAEIEQETDQERVNEQKKSLQENVINPVELFNQAINSNDIKTVKILVDEGLEIGDWESILSDNIATINQEITDYLLSKMDIDDLDDDILLTAVKSTNKVVLTSLISTCQSERFKSYVYDLMVELAEDDEAEQIELLIQCKADIHFRSEHEDQSLLAKIIESDPDHSRCIELLYQNSAKIVAFLKREYYDFCIELCSRLNGVPFEDVLLFGTMDDNLPALFYFAVEYENYHYVQTMLEHKVIRVNELVGELTQHVLDVTNDEQMQTLLKSFGAKK